MKGKTKITIEITDECGAFPVTDTYTIEKDSMLESIDEWRGVFRKMLFCAGFYEETVNGLLGENE